MMRDFRHLREVREREEKSERFWAWATGVLACLTLGFLFGTVIGVQI